MYSNLITPPDILKSNQHSVLLVDPDQQDVDAVIKFCQYSNNSFDVYVYTPNMNNLDWLQKAVDNVDSIIVNSRSDVFKELCLLHKTYYYGSTLYLENFQKIADPLHYFATKENSNK